MPSSSLGGNIGTVFAPYQRYDNEWFKVFVKKLKDVGKDITVPGEGDTYSLGDASFMILSAGGPDDNESIILRLTFVSMSFLFTGDETEEQGKEVISSGYPIESDVLKVAHHGSSLSTCYQFLRVVYPKIAVICVGKDNSYGHPTDSLLSRLKDEGATTYRTDNDGTVVITSDGERITAVTEKLHSQEKNLLPAEKSVLETQPAACRSGNRYGQQEYVLNTKSRKFHLPSCDSVCEMSEKNRKYVTSTRESILSEGYQPCRGCNP